MPTRASATEIAETHAEQLPARGWGGRAALDPLLLQLRQSPRADPRVHLEGDFEAGCDDDPAEDEA